MKLNIMSVVQTLTADLSVERVHGVDGVFSLSEMHKGVVSDLLHSLHRTCNTMNALVKSTLDLWSYKVQIILAIFNLYSTLDWWDTNSESFSHHMYNSIKPVNKNKTDVTRTSTTIIILHYKIYIFKKKQM